MPIIQQPDTRLSPVPQMPIHSRTLRLASLGTCLWLTISVPLLPTHPILPPQQGRLRLASQKYLPVDGQSADSAAVNYQNPFEALRAGEPLQATLTLAVQLTGRDAGPLNVGRYGLVAIPDPNP